MKIIIEDVWFMGDKTNEFNLPDHWSDYDYEVYIREYLSKVVCFKWNKNENLS